jgi:hypothetical protein
MALKLHIGIAFDISLLLAIECEICMADGTKTAYWPLNVKYACSFTWQMALKLHIGH